MNDDAPSRARKALPSPNSRAVVPTTRSGRTDLIALARAASARPAPTAAVPAKTAPRAEDKVTPLIARLREAVDQPASVKTVPVEDKSTALVAQIRETTTGTVPVQPKPPEPRKVETPASPWVRAVAPASVPAIQTVPVQIAPGQTVPVEVPQNAAAGAQQPINVTVNVVNEQRGYWGPYWYGYPYPYWHGCGKRHCPHLRGLPCNSWFC